MRVHSEAHLKHDSGLHYQKPLCKFMRRPASMPSKEDLDTSRLSLSRLMPLALSFLSTFLSDVRSHFDFLRPGDVQPLKYIIFTSVHSCAITMLPPYLSVFLVADVAFAATGGLLVAVVLVSKHAMASLTTDTVASNLLLANAPLSGALANAGLIFLTFLASIPGLFSSTNRISLKVHSWMVLVCVIFTLVIGLDIWFSTLKTRSNLAVVWDAQGPQIQELLQDRVSCYYVAQKGAHI
ncbi:MAG: hypothetical protein Q9174_002148 [Haloplaca sp. 1 TL-2023]